MELGVGPGIIIRVAGRRRRFQSRTGELVLEQRGTFPVGHASTRLSLMLLLQAWEAQHPAALLDVGCGSGVLALAGVALGIPWGVGCDLAASAVKVSRRNAQRNGLEPRLGWFQGSTEAIGTAFPLVVANLPYRVQLEKQPEFLRLVAPTGGLILAGFKDLQAEEVIGFYLERGWRLVARLTREQWEPEPPLDLSYTWVGCYLRRG